jgi:hypothetical protein
VREESETGSDESSVVGEEPGRAELSCKVTLLFWDCGGGLAGECFGNGVAETVDVERSVALYRNTQCNTHDECGGGGMIAGNGRRIMWEAKKVRVDLVGMEMIT